MTHRPQDLSEPSICVAVPCHNNSWQLQGLLATLLPQLKDSDEVLLIDDASDAVENELIKSWANGTQVGFCGLPPPEHPGECLGRRSEARNQAAELSDAEVILYLDGDMLLAPGYLAEIRNYHALDPKIMVRGERFAISREAQQCGLNHCIERVFVGAKPLKPEDSLVYLAKDTSRVQCAAIVAGLVAGRMAKASTGMSRRGFGSLLSRLALGGIFASSALTETPGIPYSQHWDWCASNNLSVRKEHVERIGGWDEAFIGWGEEDIDFSYRLMLSGIRPVLPEGTECRAYHLDHAVDHHLNRLTLLRNARYLYAKFPEILPLRAGAYRRCGLGIREILRSSGSGGCS